MNTVIQELASFRSQIYVPVSNPSSFTDLLFLVPEMACKVWVLGGVWPTKFEPAVPFVVGA